MDSSTLSPHIRESSRSFLFRGGLDRALGKIGTYGADVTNSGDGGEGGGGGGGMEGDFGTGDSGDGDMGGGDKGGGDESSIGILDAATTGSVSKGRRTGLGIPETIRGIGRCLDCRYKRRRQNISIRARCKKKVLTVTGAAE